jgi:hypothetical protein
MNANVEVFMTYIIKQAKSLRQFSGEVSHYYIALYIKFDQ